MAFNVLTDMNVWLLKPQAVRGEYLQQGWILQLHAPEAHLVSDYCGVISDCDSE